MYFYNNKNKKNVHWGVYVLYKQLLEYTGLCISYFVLMQYVPRLVIFCLAIIVAHLARMHVIVRCVFSIYINFRNYLQLISLLSYSI